MKLNFKEDPQEWRKSALLAALGLALLSSVLRWRKHLPEICWQASLALLVTVMAMALLRPRWFRGWYRLSLRLGFYSSQMIGRGVLMLLFIFVFIPLGLALRWSGKDPLQLRRTSDVKSCWLPAKADSPLDRLF